MRTVAHAGRSCRQAASDSHATLAASTALRRPAESIFRDSTSISGDGTSCGVGRGQTTLTLEAKCTLYLPEHTELDAANCLSGVHVPYLCQPDDSVQLALVTVIPPHSCWYQPIDLGKSGCHRYNKVCVVAPDCRGEHGHNKEVLYSGSHLKGFSSERLLIWKGTKNYRRSFGSKLQPSLQPCLHQ